MIRVSERRRARNQSVRSKVKTLVKKARRDIEAGQLDVAQSEVRDAVSALDKAASKGVLHRNTASRRKSRLMKRLARAEAAASAG